MTEPTDAAMLSEDKIAEITFSVYGAAMHPGDYAFARAIEAEIRKQDTELIRQMLEALEGVVTQVKYYESVTAAITAA